MGLFSKVIQVATGAHEREGLSLLKEALASLGASPRTERGAEGRALRAAISALKAKGLVGPGIEAEALRMIDEHESGGA